MKTFIYTIEEKTRWAHFKVYRVKRNKPVLVAESKFQFGANRGEISEVFRALHEAGKVSDKVYSKEGGYYYNRFAEEEGVRILKL